MELFLGTKDFRHDSLPSVGVLVVNLGTPDAPTAKALRPYLQQFLWDARVIEIWRPLWWLLLQTTVLPSRPKESAKLYEKIWTRDGSPLLTISRKQTAALAVELRQRIGNPIAVELGMRYGSPSIESGLQKLKEQGATRILILPLYPQYSGASSGSVFDAVAKHLMKWRWVPELRTVMQFHDHPGYIASLAANIKESWERDGRSEKLVMSFHGIPTRYCVNGDPYYCHCHKTARLLAKELQISDKEYLMTFQSQFGKEAWLGPKTDQSLQKIAASGISSVDVVCPGFITDCLETLEEIGQQYQEVFHHAGGKTYRFIPGINDRADFISAFADLAQENLSGWVTSRSEWDQEQKLNQAAESQRLAKVANLR